MNRQASPRRYGLALSAAGIALLLLATLLLAGSAQSAGGHCSASTDHPAVPSADPLRRGQSDDRPSIDSIPAGLYQGRTEAASHSRPSMFIENTSQFLAHAGGPDDRPAYVQARSSSLLLSQWLSSTTDDGLVAYWSFDNCDATDSSGNGHHGTIHGGAEYVDGGRGAGTPIRWRK